MTEFNRITAAVRSFGDLFGDLADLFGKELRLAQSELKHGLANITQAAVLFVATGVSRSLRCSCFSSASCI